MALVLSNPQAQISISAVTLLNREIEVDREMVFVPHGCCLRSTISRAQWEIDLWPAVVGMLLLEEVLEVAQGSWAPLLGSAVTCGEMVALVTMTLIPGRSLLMRTNHPS